VKIEWTIQRHWTHWERKTQAEDKQNTTQNRKLKNEQHGPTNYTKFEYLILVLFFSF
jgi:hypothetical protein